jgi:ABC-type multidrug transport system fused ATPase/permease subunit
MISSLWKVFAHFDRRAQLRAGALIVMMIAVALLEIVGIALLLPFLEVLSAPDAATSSRLLSWVKSVFGPQSSTELLLAMGMTITAFYLVKNIGTLGLYYAQGRFVFFMEAMFARRLLGTYLAQPYTFHLQRNSALLLHNVTMAVSQVFMIGVMPFLSVLMEFFVIAAIFVAVFHVEPVAALAATGSLAAPIVVFYLVLRRRLAFFGARIERHGAASKQWINQSLGAVRDIAILGRGGYFLRRFADERVTEARYRNWSNLSTLAPRPLIETIAIAGLVVVMAVILKDGERANTVLPVLGVFGVAAFRIMPSLNRLAANFTRMRVGRAAVENVLADLALGVPAGWEETDADQTAAPMPMGNIRFENVTYSYPAAAGVAVSDVSLTIPEGGSVAFIGQSGAGKSTMVNLLLGLFDPVSGSITVAERDTRGSLRGWQRRIGYVPQSIYLFDDSLKRNIALGVEDSAIDTRQLQAAIEMAALGPLVDSLAAGVDSMVGENGVRISGGERQRIGIARALYHDPDVLVLDEATSALDSDTEASIMQSIEALRNRKTIIFIAHRLSTVRQCDTLFLLDNGKMTDSGDYDTLAARNPAFRRLAALEPLAAK